MDAERDLVFFSFFAKAASSTGKTCEAILTQLRPFARRNDKFELWDRSMIPAGSNKDAAIEVALQRCRVALVLVSPEYLASEEHWQKEAKPLVTAAQEGRILLLWQQVAPCNCDAEEINEFQQLIPGAVLTKCKPAVRAQHAQSISEQVFKAWEAFAPLAQRLHVLPIDPSVSRAATPAPLRRPCDAVALVLTPSGQEKGIVRHYQWRAFIQRAGQGPCQQVPNGSLGAKPSYAQGTLEELLRCVQSWIDRELNDEPVLEIFVPDDLLDEDWGSFIVQDDEDPKLLRTYQPFLLRSSDRLLNRKWNKRAGALTRMHHHLAEGTGAWLPQDQITKIDDLETLDGETPDEFSGGAVIAAICLLPSTRLRNRAAWLWSALASMAPLVVWPSQTSSLREEQLQLCLRHLPLIREDTSQGHRVERPHCPDLASLAKARQKWRHPEVDLRGLTILVDHPERGPDRATLQALFPTSRDDPSRTSRGEGPDPPDQLLISS